MLASNPSAVDRAGRQETLRRHPATQRLLLLLIGQKAINATIIYPLPLSFTAGAPLRKQCIHPGGVTHSLCKRGDTIALR
jgi:hypothetical protein